MNSTKILFRYPRYVCSSLFGNSTSPFMNKMNLPLGLFNSDNIYELTKEIKHISLEGGKYEVTTMLISLVHISV